MNKRRRSDLAGNFGLLWSFFCVVSVPPTDQDSREKRGVKAARRYKVSRNTFVFTTNVRSDQPVIRCNLPSCRDFYFYGIIKPWTEPLHHDFHQVTFQFQRHSARQFQFDKLWMDRLELTNRVLFYSRWTIQPDEKRCGKASTGWLSSSFYPTPAPSSFFKFRNFR